MQIPSTIEGPAIVEIGGNYYESREAVKLKITDETDDKSVITRGVVAKKTKGRKAEVSFTPVKWSAFSALFGAINLARNARVFGSSNTVAHIWGADGTKVSLPRAAITGIPSVGAGAGKDLFNGAFTITGLVDPTAAYTDLASLISVSTAVMPSLPALSSGDLASGAFFALLMADASTPAADDIFLDLEEGAEISFDLKLNERKTDRTGTYDYTFQSATPSAKLKPSGPSLANWQKLVNLTSAVSKMGGVITPAFDLMIRAVAVGDPYFTLRRIVCADRELNWSESDQRYNDIDVTAMGDLGLNKFASGATAAEWEPVE